MLAHTMVLGDMSTTDKREAHRRQHAEMSADSSSKLGTALRECYHALRLVQEAMQLGWFGDLVASPSLGQVACGYLRMRLAFRLHDEVLIGVCEFSKVRANSRPLGERNGECVLVTTPFVRGEGHCEWERLPSRTRSLHHTLTDPPFPSCARGVAFAWHALTMAVAGFSGSSRQYLELAKGCQHADKPSDYLRTYVSVGFNFLGLYVDLPVAVSSGPESVSLARSLQLRSLMMLQLNFTTVATFNAGDFRMAWRFCNEVS